MKTIALLLIIIFQMKMDALIPWEANFKLRYSDFQSAIPATSYYSAESEFVFTRDFLMHNDSVFFEIRPNFSKTESWMKLNDDSLLNHEQRHFDMEEIKVRIIRKQLSDSAKFNIIGRVDLLSDKLYEELSINDSVYDWETKHGSNILQQRKWNIKIDKMLDSLKKFANPEAFLGIKK